LTGSLVLWCSLFSAEPTGAGFNELQHFDWFQSCFSIGKRDKSQGMKLLAEEVRQEIDKRISI